MADSDKLSIRFIRAFTIEADRHTRHVIECPYCLQQMVFTTESQEERNRQWLLHIGMVHGRLMSDRVH